MRTVVSNLSFFRNSNFRIFQKMSDTRQLVFIVDHNVTVQEKHDATNFVYPTVMFFNESLPLE